MTSDAADTFPTPPTLDLPVSFAAARAIVERELEQVVPGYAGWDQEARSRWRATQDHARQRLKEQALDNILVAHTPITHERLRRTKGLMSKEDLVDIVGIEGREFRNLCALAMDGIGEDWYVLNEYMPEGRSLADYHTVGAWDREQHALQIQGMEQDGFDQDKIAPHRRYEGHLYAEWGRIAHQDRLTYLLLHSLAHYVVSLAESHGDDLVHTLVPYGYAKNPDHGKDVGNGSKIWSMRTDAGGKEAILEAVQKAQAEHIAARTAVLKTRFAQEAMGVVWCIRPEEEGYAAPNEENRVVIFSDPTAMDNVRWTSFLSDIAAIAGDPEILEEIVRQEKALMETVLTQAYAQAEAAHPEAAALPPHTPPTRSVDDLF